MSISRTKKILIAVFVPVMMLVFGSCQGVVSAVAPGLIINSFAAPANFSVGQSGTYEVTVTNASGIPSEEGSNIIINDTLPEGVSVEHVGLFVSEVNHGESD